ncbi:MAG: ATP-binding cassette domain-containing protein [Actinobacteria bacterium]|nr:ATP-binding cassette domain-containing protein [Actinomycetota bacterium]NCX52561.1 ATP-binding cassette domain-containing protein [Actinomycetota bacterium]
MIKFSNVSLIYPNSTTTVIEDLNLEIAEGELVLVIGPTGSGKSSLLRLINGLVPHHTGGILAGSIEVDGISTAEVKPGGLAHLIGIVGQNPINGFVADTVEEELVFGMEALNLSNETMRKRVEEVLDLMSLAALRNRTIATLSGGEQQRVAIASALVAHPKVLVLDEPTSALDPIAAEEVLSILHRLVHDLSLTVVIAEHKLERVIQFADRIVHINGAGTAVVGTPEEVLMNSPIAPPIVELARTLGLKEIGVSVREMRRMTQEFRESHELTQQESVSVSFKPCVSIKNLTISYSGKNAVNSLSATIYENEIVAIMGRNGAGKSSLLRAIAGVSDNAAGQVIVNGIDSQKLHSKQRRENVGYIPQEPSDLLYGQSVIEECKQADSDNQVEAGTTFALLSQLVPGITAHIHPRDLSEGQRLGLALSVVLSANPRLLILDEPTRGLDYQAKRVLTKMLIDFARVFNRSVIIATHDVELVAELATRTIFVADGDMVADGATIDVLLSSPAFAPQVSKIMAPQPWLTVADVVRAIEADK